MSHRGSKRERSRSPDRRDSRIDDRERDRGQDRSHRDSDRREPNRRDSRDRRDDRGRGHDRDARDRVDSRDNRDRRDSRDRRDDRRDGSRRDVPAVDARARDGRTSSTEMRNVRETREDHDIDDRLIREARRSPVRSREEAAPAVSAKPVQTTAKDRAQTKAALEQAKKERIALLKNITGGSYIFFLLFYPSNALRSALFVFSTQATHRKRMRSPVRSVPAASAPRAKKAARVWKEERTRRCSRKRMRRRT